MVPSSLDNPLCANCRPGPVMKTFAAACLAFLLACASSLAQTARQPEAKPNAIPHTDMEKKKGDLSDKLNSTNGVIHPDKNVDPGIRRPAPATGATPVIPPPGSPGGAQNVEPK